MPFRFNPFTGRPDNVGAVDVLTTKGDLLTRNASDLARLPVGADGQVLIASSVQPEGLAWSTPVGAGDVSSNTAISVDNEIVLFSGVSGKLIKRASETGIVKLTAGVLSAVTAPSGAIVGDLDTQTLQNKTLDNTNIITVKDSLFTIQDDGDITKQIQFQLSGLTTGLTRTKTFQDISGMLYETGGQDVSVADGGTGQSTYTDGQLLIGNSATTGLTKTTLTAGSGIIITNGNGSIEIGVNPAGVFVLKAGDTMTGTLNIFPSTDASALILKENIAQPLTRVFQIQNSAGTFRVGCNNTNLFSTTEGFTMEFDTTSVINPGFRRVGLVVTLNAGYTGSSFTTALSFTNSCQATSTSWIADVSTGFGYRPNGNRGIFGGAIGDTVGVNVGGLGSAGKGSINIGLMGTSTTNKLSAVNIGVFGTGLQLSGGAGAASIGGYFTLYNTATAPPNLVTAALIADNQTFASAIFLARDNGTEVLRIFDTGQFTFTSTVPTANIAASTEKIQSDFNFSATKTWATGPLATQREVVFRAPTYAFATASTITTAATVAITGAPIAGSNATITTPLSFWIQAGNSLFAGSVAMTGFTNSSFVKEKLTNTAVANYTVLTTDYIIAKTAITATTDTIILPDPAVVGSGTIYVVKDAAGTAGTTNYNVTTTAGLIDGAATFPINANYQSTSFYSNGSNWFTF